MLQLFLKLFNLFINYYYLLIILLFVILIYIYNYITENNSYFKYLNIPYEKPKFFIGNLRNYPFIQSNKEHQFYFIEKIYNKYENENYVGFFKYKKPMLMIRNPNICSEILTKYFENFQNRPGPKIDVNKNPLSNHLINLHGNKWKIIRNKLTPVFTPFNLKNMFIDLNDCIKELNEYLNNILNQEYLKRYENNELDNNRNKDIEEYDKYEKSKQRKKSYAKMINKTMNKETDNDFKIIQCKDNEDNSIENEKNNIKEYNNHENNLKSKEHNEDKLYNYDEVNKEEYSDDKVRKRYTNQIINENITNKTNNDKVDSDNINKNSKKLKHIDLELISLFSKFDLKVSGKCIFGLNNDILINPNSKYNKLCSQLFEPNIKTKYKQIIQYLFLNKFIETKNITKETYKLLKEIINDALNEKNNKNIKRNDFLKLIMDIKNEGNKKNEREKNIRNNEPGVIDDNHEKDGAVNEKTEKYLTENYKKTLNGSDTYNNTTDNYYLNDSIIMSNIFIFLTTGYESTATTIASFLYELAINLHIQDELREVIQTITDEDGNFSYNTLMECKYLDNVISESQRLHPVNTSLSRQVTSDRFQLPGTDIYINKGTHICIPTFAMYKDEKYFENPNIFNPDRFSNSPKFKLFAPFGEGPRQCIAKKFALMEIKYVIADLILKYKFLPCGKTEIPLTYIPNKLFITPKNGIWVKFETIEDE